MPVWNEENVAHLLRRAGFGPDSKDLTRYLRYEPAQAVEKLVSVKGSNARGPGRSDNDAEDRADLRAWWAKRMVTAKGARLQEKMCLFWHDHFATGVDVVKNNLWMSLQNRTFRQHGLGPFHRLVLEITRDPAMLDFLDGRRNQRIKPNENYGRELMELFVLGVVDLDGVENYTQADVGAITRALTGFVIQNDAGVFDASRFDGDPKTLFAGKPFQATGNLGVVDAAGLPLPPAQNVIDILFTHRDSDGELTMPRFLARKLWEYFAFPAPPKALIDEIAAPFVAGGFVIRDLLRALFTHEAFYSDAAKTSSVKNPCEYAFSAMRALRAGTNGRILPDLLADMGMDLFDPPSVNGWNQGMAWLSSGQFLARIEFAQALAAGRDSFLRVTPRRVIDPRATSADTVVDGLLARFGIAASVPPGARQALIDYFEGATDFTDPEVQERKVRGAIALALTLPESHVH